MPAMKMAEWREEAEWATTSSEAGNDARINLVRQMRGSGPACWKRGRGAEAARVGHELRTDIKITHHQLLPRVGFLFASQSLLRLCDDAVMIDISPPPAPVFARPLCCPVRSSRIRVALLSWLTGTRDCGNGYEAEGKLISCFRVTLASRVSRLVKAGSIYCLSREQCSFSRSGRGFLQLPLLCALYAFSKASHSRIYSLGRRQYQKVDDINSVVLAFWLIVVFQTTVSSFMGHNLRSPLYRGSGILQKDSGVGL